MPDTAAQPTPATPDELAALYLRDRDVPCPACGYNRRDGTTAACPECHASVHLFDNSADRWLSLSKRRSVFVATVMLAFCIVYWISYCTVTWERIELISLDLRGTSSWMIRDLALFTPGVACLPLASWHFARMLRCRATEKAGSIDRAGAHLFRGFFWCVVGLGASTTFDVGVMIWEHIP